jgi:aspartyl/asparaginyl beta-hydroxylase (cupin superfamily)
MAAGPGSEQNARVTAMAQTALALMRDRRLDDAARAWSSILAIAPGHAQALFHLGQHHLLRGDLAAASQYLENAFRADPGNPAIPLNLAFVRRASNDNTGEMAWLTRSLSIDPYFFPALLAKGMLQERMGDVRQAARTFRDVLLIAPPDSQLGGEILQSMRHAREAVARNAAEFDDFLRGRLAGIRSRYPGEDFARFDECREIVLGKTKPYPQQPSMLLVPRLPAIPFYDRALFPWLKTLEDATAAVREEFLVAAKEDGGNFEPYVSHPEGAPLAQWAELNRSMRWNVLYLWRDGLKREEQCRRCPRTTALLESIPMLDARNFGPTVLFSVLEPHTHIPPHSGDTNARLIIHFPLIVPRGCRFRVGNEVREWRVGETWVFDDTIDHEAWNDSDEPRVIMMIDIWNPLLTAAERELVSGLLNGMNAYYSQPAS